jgi:hypothetical protein
MNFREVFQRAKLTPQPEGVNKPHEGLVVALSNTCVNCGEFAHLHAEGSKCLFGPLSFKANDSAVERYRAHCAERERFGRNEPGFWDQSVT